MRRFIALLGGLLLCCNAFAIDAKIIFLKGSVQVSSLDGKEYSPKKGDTLTEADRIITGEKSLVIIRIENHSTHRIEENSDIIIEDLPYYFENSKELEHGGSVIIQIGTIFSDIIQKSDIRSFQVRSHNTAMAVRGTKIMISVEEDGNLWASVKSGELEIQNFVSGQTDVMNNNESMLVESDERFTQARRYDWIENLSWDISNIEDIEKITSFSSIKDKVTKEFRIKRKAWVRNELKWNKKVENWKQREEKWQVRTADLKPNLVRQQRNEVIDQLIKQKREQDKKIMKDPQGKGKTEFKQKMLKQTTHPMLKRSADQERVRERIHERQKDNMQRMRRLERFRPLPLPPPPPGSTPTNPSQPPPGGPTL